MAAAAAAPLLVAPVHGTAAGFQALRSAGRRAGGRSTHDVVLSLWLM